jgi:hypothetical protein
MNNSRNIRMHVVAIVSAFAPWAAFAAGDATDESVATLRASLGAVAVEVDEVRITGDGVACIDYRVRGAGGGESRGHAVVRGKDVQRSPAAPGADAQVFEKAWSDHCLGPKGGTTIDQ